MRPGSRAGPLSCTAYWLAPLSFAILVLAAAIVVVPVASMVADATAAFVEQFSVTTDKDIYSKDERIIVAGTLPSSSPPDAAGAAAGNGNADDGDKNVVRIQVSREDRQCALQVVSADPNDRSFVSKPIRVGNCGPGQYTVAAHYQNQTATTVFIMTADEADTGSEDLRLRVLKRTILQAQESTSERVKEVIDAGILLPKQAADAYRRGVIETSLALQAAQHGDTAAARSHQLEAITQFREVLASLAPERLSAIAVQAEQQSLRVLSSSGGGSEKLAMLEDLYQRLADLAQKNGLQSSDLGRASTLLAEAKAALDTGGEDAAAAAETASKKLDEAAAALEQVRSQLVSHAGGGRQGDGDGNSNNGSGKKDDNNNNNNNDNNNNNNQSGNNDASSAADRDAEQKKQILESADRLEAKARSLLKDEGDGEGKSAEKIREALSLLDRARTKVAEGEYSHARDLLADAARLLAKAGNGKGH
jgi:hypothetical protein